MFTPEELKFLLELLIVEQSKYLQKQEYSTTDLIQNIRNKVVFLANATTHLSILNQ